MKMQRHNYDSDLKQVPYLKQIHCNNVNSLQVCKIKLFYSLYCFLRLQSKEQLKPDFIHPQHLHAIRSSTFSIVIYVLRARGARSHRLLFSWHGYTWKRGNSLKGSLSPKNTGGCKIALFKCCRRTMLTGAIFSMGLFFCVNGFR